MAGFQAADWEDSLIIINLINVNRVNIANKLTSDADDLYPQKIEIKNANLVEQLLVMFRE